MEHIEPKPALDLLPYDVWAYIFHYVGPDYEIKKIAAARRTCKLFNDFLEPKAFRTLWFPWLCRPILQLLAICHRQGLGRMVKDFDVAPRRNAESDDLRLLQRLREAIIQTKVFDQTDINRRLKLDILNGLNKGNSDAIYAVAFCLCPRIDFLDLRLNEWRHRFRKRLLKGFGSTLHGRVLKHIALGTNVPVPKGISHIKTLDLDASDEAFISWMYLLNIATLESIVVRRARILMPAKKKVPIMQSNLRHVEIQGYEIDTNGVRYLIECCKNMETLDISLPDVKPDEFYALSLPQVGNFLRQHRPPLKHLAWEHGRWMYRNPSRILCEFPFGDLRCLHVLTVLSVDEPHLFGDTSQRTHLREVLPNSLQRLRVDCRLEYSDDDKRYMAWNDEQCNDLVADPLYAALKYVSMFRGKITLPRSRPDEGWPAWAANFPRGVSYVAHDYVPESDEQRNVNTYLANMALLDEAASRSDDALEGSSHGDINH